MPRKPLSDALLTGAVPPLMAGYAKSVLATTRWRREGDENFQALIASGEPFICALWHSRLLLMPAVVPEMGRELTAIVSAHRDGEVIARVLSRLNVKAARGSAADPRKPDKAKGGAGALKRLVALARSGSNTAITPDGPRGPRQRAQPGIAQLARLTGLPVLPMAYATRNARYLPTWDGFLLPLPFGEGVFVFGEPVRVSEVESGRLAIERALNRVTARADEAMGHAASLPAPDSPALEAAA